MTNKRGQQVVNIGRLEVDQTQVHHQDGGDALEQLEPLPPAGQLHSHRQIIKRPTLTVVCRYWWKSNCPGGGGGEYQTMLF